MRMFSLGSAEAKPKMFLDNSHPPQVGFLSAPNTVARKSHQLPQAQGSDISHSLWPYENL